MKSFFTFIFLATCWSNTAFDQIKANSLLEKVANNSPILISDVSIFDGISPELQTNQDVLISNGIIEWIKPHDTELNSTDYFVLNGFGKTLMPGMIDAHVHLSGNGSVPWDVQKVDVKNNLSAYLYAGVTTVYDLGGLGKSIDKLAACRT